MNQIFKTISALALGAGAAYYLDPALGRQRRATVNDKLHSASRTTQHYLAAQSKRATDRARGLVASARSRWSSSAKPSDRLLGARVRARLGRVASYPHAIETEVSEGRVTLRGPLPAGEIDAIIAAVETMPGVQSIDNQLILHENTEGVPGLQGEPHRAGRKNSYLLGEAAAPALAVAGGLGAGYRALHRARSKRTAPLSLAIALLAYGVGDGARRIARHRRAMPEQAPDTASGQLRMTGAATPPADTTPSYPGQTSH